MEEGKASVRQKPFQAKGAAPEFGFGERFFTVLGHSLEAFSDEVGHCAGPRGKNALKQKLRARFRFSRNGKALVNDLKRLRTFGKEFMRSSEGV
jgi:hypothetical protein